MNTKHLTSAIFTLAALILFTLSCEREWNNPWDEKASLDPNAWAPQNLQITDVSITEKKLIWTYGDENIEGFKLDRKKGDEPWQIAHKTFPKEARNWNDAEIVPDPAITYSYRLYAFAGQYSSSQNDASFNAAIPAPQNLQITMNSVTSVTLNWQDNINGEEGFKIDRKINQDTWVLEFMTLNANQTSFTDSGLDLLNNVYTYRLYAFVQNFNSQQTESSAVSLQCGYSFTDSRDGNQYETIEIGDQCWMKENLAWLPSVSPSANGSETSSYYYVYGYEGTSVAEAKATENYQTYGVLYNWPAALDACPPGWHLPSDSEWDVLVNYLGGSSVAGGKMKEAGTAHWNSPNTGATNESGFSGLPGGTRYPNGSFDAIGNNGHWWSSTETSSSNAWRRDLYYDSGDVYRGNDNKEYGFSIRCLRD